MQSNYVMLPGARLEIGPDGRPLETLGACCAACAKKPLSGFTDSPVVGLLIFGGLLFAASKLLK